MVAFRWLGDIPPGIPPPTTIANPTGSDPSVRHLAFDRPYPRDSPESWAAAGYIHFIRSPPKNIRKKQSKASCKLQVGKFENLICVVLVSTLGLGQHFDAYFFQMGFGLVQPPTRINYCWCFRNPQQPPGMYKTWKNNGRNMDTLPNGLDCSINWMFFCLYTFFPMSLNPQLERWGTGHLNSDLHRIRGSQRVGLVGSQQAIQGATVQHKQIIG